MSYRGIVILYDSLQNDPVGSSKNTDTLLMGQEHNKQWFDDFAKLPADAAIRCETMTNEEAIAFLKPYIEERFLQFAWSGSV